MNNREDVFKLIDQERARQSRLCAEGKFPWTCNDPTIRHESKLAVLMEEVGEVARCLNENTIHNSQTHLDQDALVAELTQVAAVATAWIESLLPTRGRCVGCGKTGVGFGLIGQRVYCPDCENRP